MGNRFPGPIHRDVGWVRILIMWPNSLEQASGPKSERGGMAWVFGNMRGHCLKLVSGPEKKAGMVGNIFRASGAALNKLFPGPIPR